MADKRMFSVKIVESDAFYLLSLSAQALYFHLNMAADDDGIVDSPNKVIRGLCTDNDDKAYKKQQRELKKGLSELIEKRFVLLFPSGVICIKHWRMQNQIKKDRYKPTNYQDELSSLEVKTNGSYTEKRVETSALQNGDIMETSALRSIDKYSIDKSSICKDSIGECRGGKETNGADTAAQTPPRLSADALSSPPSAYLGKHENVLLSKKEVAQLKLVFPTDWRDKVEQMSDYLFHGGRCDVPHYDFILSFV